MVAAPDIDVADILNISCYKFTPLPDANALRETLLACAQELDLKGTVLLAEEGINFFLAGPAAAVRSFIAQLKLDPRFADLNPKESWSDHVPFRKMLVKVKREIIRMDHPPSAPPAGAPRSRRPRYAAGWSRAMTTKAAKWSPWTRATTTKSTKAHLPAPSTGA